MTQVSPQSLWDPVWTAGLELVGHLPPHEVEAAGRFYGLLPSQKKINKHKHHGTCVTKKDCQLQTHAHNKYELLMISAWLQLDGFWHAGSLLYQPYRWCRETWSSYEPVKGAIVHSSQNPVICPSSILTQIRKIKERGFVFIMKVFSKWLHATGF